MKSNFDNDLTLEKELAKFLDKNFYPWLRNNDSPVIDYNRVYDKESQKKGIDITLDLFNNKTGIIETCNIDEKSTSHYLNKGIPTFAFELSYIDNNKKNKTGWLLDNNKETDFYALIWPNIKEEKYAELTKEFGDKQQKWQGYIKSDDFFSMELWMINRLKLLNYLNENYNLSKEKLKKINDNIRENRDVNPRFNNDKSPNKRYKFTYTRHLNEKPINLVIWKNTIRSIASKFFISENSVSILKKNQP